MAKALDKEITYRRIYLYSNTTKIIYLYSLNVKIIVGAQCQMKMWGLVFKNEEFQDGNSTALNKAWDTFEHNPVGLCISCPFLLLWFIKQVWASIMFSLKRQGATGKEKDTIYSEGKDSRHKWEYF